MLRRRLLDTARTGRLGAQSLTTTIPSTPPPMIPVSIGALTPAEARLFGLLRSFAAGQSPPVTVRVAGGWVRDKLLGCPSADLDLCVDSGSGLAFALAWTEHLSQLHSISPGTQSTSSAPADPSRTVETLGNSESPLGLTPSLGLGSVARIEANPSQSKHLETAHVRVLGLDLDFVALRSDTYAADCAHRIPQIRLGTAHEDAHRRDLTINSLFYNLATDQIEDLTTRALPDLLHARLIRTPLDPQTTFADDPLRVLRAIRFAARLDFALDPALLNAASDAQTVQPALRAKVTRERIGIELNKILSSRHIPSLLLPSSSSSSSSSSSPSPGPLQAIQYFTKAKLWQTILRPNPDTLSPEQLAACPAPGASEAETEALSFAQTLLDISHLPIIVQAFSQEPQIWRRIWLAVFVSPWRKLRLPPKPRNAQPKHAKQPLKPPVSEPMVEHLIKEGIKLPANDAKYTGHLYASAALLRAPRLDRFSQPTQRAALALALTDPSIKALSIGLPSAPPAWRIAVGFSAFLEIAENRIKPARDEQVIIEEYQTLIQAISDYDISSQLDRQPLLNGKEIQALLNIKAGLWMTTIMKELTVWEYQYPDASKADAERWLMTQWSDSTSSIRRAVPP